ncbi:MAG TPA: hypothetical protein VK203_20610 [Nostocaceae cyanobacterium]|nr:hypothetical protein [Nostocaceae cyanobacterium]
MTVEQKIQQALKWWTYRQSIKLFLEAENIRDGLLQELLTIRRDLELLAIDKLNLSVAQMREYLLKIEQFYPSLQKLSDRLCPVSIQDSLPLSIESLLEIWITSKPHLCFHINLPAYWRHESVESSLVILRTLEELLTIILPELLTPIVIEINLKQEINIAQLTVQLTYPDISTLIFHTSLPELEYLYDSFQILLSGQCFCQSQNLKAAWHFLW